VGVADGGNFGASEDVFGLLGRVRSEEGGGRERRTMSLSSYCWGTERRAAIFSYMRGLVSPGRSSSL
jgi:hypothetical protein